MITLIIGDIDEKLSVYSKTINEDAKLLNEDEIPNLSSGTYYTSIGDFVQVENFKLAIEKADKIIYHTPNKWSDTDTRGVSQIQINTEQIFEQVKNKKIINGYKKYTNELTSFIEERYLQTFVNEEYSHSNFDINEYKFDLFPPLFYKFKFDFDWQKLEPKINNHLRKIPDDVNTPGPNVTSSVYITEDLPHNWPELNEFMQLVDKIIYKLIEVNRMSSWDPNLKNNQKLNSSYKISFSWINKHGHDGQLREHHHGNAHFVISAYLQAPKNSGTVLFRDPLEYHKTLWSNNDYGPYENPMDIRRDFYRWRELTPETNDILVWPGFINHIVTPNKNIDSERVVLGLLINI